MSGNQPKQSKPKPQPTWYMDKYGWKWNEARELLEFMKQNNIKDTKNILK